ncbi:TetR/AcrR family transcriptional regulator [Paenibacillus illinoisensis]|uniref:Tetracycline transcriptional regulator QacR domain protein n=1 Tax=Paenibacillus illinoisensis TaxID=59845 RepID=A0A2W0C5L4_9BACL|nr:TetR/AcrR family transcriptional regulator [Paenibacillus illinoisensis]PYY27923.1 Tetracycline transcriptional regulator QacR domain protein [Paenibacillus illinoisensis]
MNKKHLQSEQTKRGILLAAGQLFREKGYSATSIEDIVAITGKSKGNIYYHFGSKEALFLYLLEDWETEWRSSWLEKEPLLSTFSEKIDGLFQTMANDMYHPLTNVMDEFLSKEWNNTKIQASVTHYVEGHIAFIRDILEIAMLDGEIAIDDSKSLATILEAMIQGLALMASRMNGNEMKVLYRKAAQVFLQGVLNPKPYLSWYYDQTK